VFLGHSPEIWGPEDFDAAFASWAADTERRGYDEEAVVQILGAALGRYCELTLDMRWVVITDEDGSAAGLRGAKKGTSEQDWAATDAL
jgi:hypothetical protein